MARSAPIHGSAERRVVVTLLLLAALGGCERSSSVSQSDPLPGAAPRPPGLVARLRDAAAHEAAPRAPRTRHRRADGTARFTNRLILERSPYLRQHAHNPVDWYPWGDEAFVRAKREGKLILLSVGYATCHWCHVMEEESFEDEEIATRMNADYVAIKVDREERPDVDATYLQAVALLTGGGGWPMTVWLTPDREVFFAGTYFPPRDGDRGARTGFLSLLRHFSEGLPLRSSQHRRRRACLDGACPCGGEREPGRRDAGTIRARRGLRALPRCVRSRARRLWTRSEVPHAIESRVSAAIPSADRSTAALMMVQQTLGGMMRGGVRDQLGGGFHRYATDGAWQVPHFEKMLYDNAQLANVYLEAWQATKDAEWRDAARAILEDLLRTLRAPEGAFYAAVDADDPVGEGAYYTWTPAELEASLAAEDAQALAGYYGVTLAGNLDGRTVLHVVTSPAEVGARLGVDAATAAERIGAGRARLLTARATRPAPLVDSKVLAGWNGLAISAFARVGVALAEPGYLRVAREAADFVLERMWTGDHLLRVHSDGSTGQAAFLEDYAFLTAGMLDLFEATAELRWLDAAKRLHAVLDRDFWDPETGAYFDSGHDRDPSLPRTKPADDGAIPSGNAVAAENLLRFAVLGDDESARQRAATTLRALGRDLTANPTGAARLLGVVEAMLDRPREVVVVGPAGETAAGASLRATVQAQYLPNRAIVATREGEMLEALSRAVAFVGEKHAIDGRPTAYVCERGRASRRRPIRRCSRANWPRWRRSPRRRTPIELRGLPALCLRGRRKRRGRVAVKDEDIAQLAVNTIRTLAIDAVQKANSGHPWAPDGSRTDGVRALATTPASQPAQSALGRA
jgi:uncharacterized protein YyaL (SSP411 family)